MTRFVGIDGEGLGRSPHRYTLLAACDEDGRRLLSIEKPDGELSTKECLDGLLSLPQRNVKFFAYSFGYDLTKILKDLPDRSLYRLVRPEERFRPGRSQPDAVNWQGYRLNLMATRFTLSRGKRRVVIWDVWKFFQGRFVKALEQWGVETDLETMSRMKAARGEFTSESWDDIRAYCYSECTALGQLVRKLTDAHIKAGFPLKNYFGAGSTASVVLDSMGIRNLRDEGPPAMTIPVASAFFGGRFENSVVGSVKGNVHSWDIASAYPYSIAHLPCLIHGRWHETKRESDVKKARAALINYQLGHCPANTVWGPFPFRRRDGTIVYPVSGGIGWVWRDEYLAAKRVHPNVHFRSAWVLKSTCKCPSPFARIPELYCERVRIGKEGPGIVLKLGMNSCYGKLAQSIGTKPPYQSWIWAGMITSGCRAQILDMLALHKRQSDLLMVATDGIYSKAKLVPPIPLPTNTEGLVGPDGKSKPPLGSWEGKIIRKRGVFAARPGVYFPQNPTEAELADVRGRGVGKGTVLTHWRSVVAAQQAGEPHVILPSVVRFHGIKSSIHPRLTPEGVEYHRAETYGEWSERPVMLSFDPGPKRDVSFAPWHVEPNLESCPYDRGIVSAEAAELKAAALEAEEQPDVE